MNVAIVLAGGVGARLGKGIPKQFVEVLDKPILAYTLEKFQHNANIDVIEIVSHKDYVSTCQEIAQRYGITKAKWYVNGGASYPESTVNGLFFLKDKINEDDLVVIHGSCAPLVTEQVINNAIETCKKYGNAMPVQQIYLSTCLKDDETCTSRPIDKETIVQVQFPLVFRFNYILSLYEKSLNDGSFSKLGLHLQYVVFANGGIMHFSEGDDRNFKITTQADLDFFEGYLLLQKNRNKEEK